MNIADTAPISDSQVKSGTSENYSVEFFHIYTDETISESHEASLQYLNEAKKAWTFDHQTVVMIDNYNPTEHITSSEEILGFLESKNALPDFWAYEGDLINNAKILLDSVTSNKLKKNYTRYIEQHGKYPCSLLTATWYLTRLGALPSVGILRQTSDKEFVPAKRLINILPQDYKPIELKAANIIKHTGVGEYSDKIQNLYVPRDSGRELSLY